MNYRPLALCLFSLGCLTTPGPRCLADTPATDPDLPQSFNPAPLEMLSKKSPFNRVVDFSDTYVLTGVAYVQGKPLATLLNKETKQHFVVSETPNAQGWQLKEANPGDEPKHAGVKLLVDGETVSLRYLNTPVEPTQTGRPRRVVEPVDIHNLKDSDVIRKGKDGKEYVRGSIYLPQADREYYYNDMSREAHDQYRQIIEDNRDRMLRYNADQRAAFSKKVFDKVVSDEKAKKP